MGPDGISYLDMAGKLLQRDFSPLAHPYWSPLYPSLLSFALKALPAPAMEFPAVHLANWLIGLSALASFTFFLSQYLRVQGAAKGGESVASFCCRTGFAYVLFLWGTVEAVSLVGVSPDLCITALVYLIAGLYCRLVISRSRSWITSGLLGIVLGLACLAKAAMMPLGAVFLVLLAVPRLSVPARRSSLAIAALGFVIILGPYVTSLSLRQHRLTFGEAGRLNYAWLVQGRIPLHAGWIGLEPATGIPLHPPRILSNDPLVLEYKDTLPATFPLWYDPAYFHEGLQVKFDFRKQISTLAQSMQAFRWAAGSSLYPLLAGLFVLGCFASWRQAWIHLSKSLLLIWSLAAFGMYALVTIEPRYTAAFLVLFWLGVYDAFSPGRLRSAQRGAISVTAICILLFQLHSLGKTAADTMPTSGSSPHVVVAGELARLGLHAGDEIATVGSGFNDYYARLARLRIVASIGWTGIDRSGEEHTQALNDNGLNAIGDKLRRLHVRAIVSRKDRVVTVGNEWRSIGDTGYCVLWLE